MPALRFGRMQRAIEAGSACLAGRSNTPKGDLSRQTLPPSVSALLRPWLAGSALKVREPPFAGPSHDRPRTSDFQFAHWGVVLA